MSIKSGLSYISLGLLCGVSLAVMNTAHAKVEPDKGVPVPPMLKMNGYSVFNSYFSHQSNNTNGKQGSPHFEVPVSDLTLKVEGVAGNGIRYGYTANFQTYPNASPVVDQNYIHFTGMFGTFHFGNVSGVNDRFVYDGSRIIGGTGGFDGGYSQVVNLAQGAIKGNSMVGESDEATKISWYSPQVWGFQLGLSYTPNTAHSGDSKRDTRAIANDSPGNSSSIYPNKKVTPYGLDNAAIGLTYNNNIGDLRVTLSGVALTERSYIAFNIPSSVRRVRLRDAKSYQLGAIFGWHDFQIGGGYLNNGHSRIPKTNEVPLTGTLTNLNLATIAFQDGIQNGNSGSAYNLATSYKMGVHQIAGSFQRTTRKTDGEFKARNEVYTVTYDVKVLQGLSFFVEGDYVRSKSNAKIAAIHQQILDNNGDGKVALKNNDAMLLITGMKVSF